MIDEYKALIARLEALDGPDREVDAEIEARRLGKKKAYPADFEHAPHYTASIDAALTLVPGGWDVELEIFSDNSTGVTLRAPATPVKKYLEERDVVTADSVYSPAIALCIAALKARQNDD